MARLTYKDKQYESSTQAGIDKQFNITGLSLFGVGEWVGGVVVLVG